MNKLYVVLGVSKQAHWKMVKKITKQNDLKRILIQNILQVRSMHPKMGAKKIYSLLKPDEIGRDRFIEIYCESGFQVVC
jgi:putative transposase